MELQYEPTRIFAQDPSGRVVAEVTFPLRNGVADIDHTFVDGSLRGQGMADRLLWATADQLRTQGLRAHLTCTYAVKWFQEHPQEQDLLV